MEKFFGTLSAFEIIGISVGIVVGLLGIINFFVSLSDKKRLLGEKLTKKQREALLQYIKIKNSLFSNIIRYIFCLLLIFIVIILPKIIDMK